MGFRFYRRVRILPGLSVNFSRSGPSLSVGVRGAHVTVGRRGICKTVGIPGTGIFWTSFDGYHHSGVHTGLGGRRDIYQNSGRSRGILLPLVLLAAALIVLLAVLWR